VRNRRSGGKKKKSEAIWHISDRFASEFCRLNGKKPSLSRRFLVLVAGLEPARIAPRDFESRASANFATPARHKI
jgi:hypothetical protein